VRRADKLATDADCLKTWEPQPPGTLRACQGIGYRSAQVITFPETFDRVEQDTVCRLENSDLKAFINWRCR
jgi:hypothetical protein